MTISDYEESVWYELIDLGVLTESNHVGNL